MYGIFTYIWHRFMVNVGRYAIHGSSWPGFVRLLQSVFDRLWHPRLLQGLPEAQGFHLRLFGENLQQFQAWIRSIWSRYGLFLFFSFFLFSTFSPFQNLFLFFFLNSSAPKNGKGLRSHICKNSRSHEALRLSFAAYSLRRQRLVTRGPVPIRNWRILKIGPPGN